MRVIGWIAIALMAFGGLVQAEELLIDDFEYADEAAAWAAWKASEDQESPPVESVAREAPAKGKALKMPCPFTKDVERAYWDREVALDLSRVGKFTFDFYCARPEATSHLTVYFRSGEGWYAAAFAPEAGWQEVTLTKSQFGSEDTPAGWGKVDGIRLSQWKTGEADTYIAIDNLKAHSAEIAVVLSTQAMARASSEARSVESFAKAMQSLLVSAGIDADLLADEDVEAGALAERKVAIFAYPPYVGEGVMQAARQFVDGGGKVFVFYSLDPAMADLLGVRAVGYRRPDPAGQFAKVALEAPDIQGLPVSVRQDSWNITTAAPARADARAIGWWEDDQGKRDPDPAIILSDTGLFMGHVLTGADAATKEQLMAALIGHFMPEVWVQRAEKALGAVPKVGPFTSVEEVRQFVTTNAPEERQARAKELLAEGEQALKAAQDLLAGGRAAKATEEAGRAHLALREAYIMAHRPRDGEFRAMWEHSGAGAFPDEGWQASIDRMADAGFNAIVPNMWWGGLAHYDSEYLPHSDTFTQHGDQIAQCVEAAHKRGVEVHAWKVNWNLSTAPQAFVDALRAEKRTMVSAAGAPVDWLCPSHPANYQLELDTMLEVARKYDVDGVHFDYIRYLDDDVCYCDGCRERFEAETGQKVANWPADCYNGPLHDRYRDFRCDQITRLVRATSEEVRKLKPYCKISAAVFSDYPNCRTYVGQDWVKWVEEGYLDFVCPMDYTDSNGGFRRTVARQIAQVGGRIPLYPGIGASAPGLPADQVIAQVDITRELGSDGFIIFALGRDTVADHVPALGQGATSRPTFLTHNAPQVVFELPGEPDPADGAVHLPKKAFTARVTLAGLGEHRREARAASGAIELQTTGGVPVAKLGDLPGKVGGTTTVTVPPGEGRLRTVATGELRFAEGKPMPFVVRSVPFVFE